MSTEKHVLQEATVGTLRQHLWGILHAHEGRYEEAIDAFRRAIETDAKMVASFIELGMVYASRREYARMVEALRQAVESAPVP